MKKLLPWLTLALLNVTVFCQGVDPLDNWIWRNPLPTGESLTSVTYANGQFVAVGGMGVILTSPDGINWTKRFEGIGSYWSLSRIAYGNGRFVVPISSFVLTSLDGTNWTQSALTPGFVIEGLCYGNGLFAAAGYANSTAGIFTSADGKSWTQRASPSSDLFSIAYGNGLFVATGRNAILVSTNGIGWANLGVNIPSNLMGIIYRNGLFVAVGSGGTVLTSMDGTNWFARASGSTQSLGSIGYGNGQFMIPEGRGSMLSSADGIQWTRHLVTLGPHFDDPYPNDFSGVSGLFVAVGYGTATILTSPDLTNWTSRTVGPTTAAEVVALAYGAGLYVAASIESLFLISKDGLTWEAIPTPLDRAGSRFGPSAVAYGKGLFVAIDHNHGATSSDGLQWTVSSELASSFSTLIYANGLFVTTGGVGGYGAIAASRDGTNWTTRTFTLARTGAGGILSIAYGNGQFVAVGGDPATMGWGTGGFIFMSADGTNWSQINHATFDALVGVAFGNSRFVAVSTSGEVLISPDGISWPLSNVKDLDPGTLNGGGALAFGDGQFLAWWLGPIYSSRDGKTWTPHAWKTESAPLAISYLNGSFWSLGEWGSILECRTIPRLGFPQGLPGGTVQIPVLGVPSRTNTIQASTDLTYWNSLTNVVLSEGLGQFSDTAATNLTRRFYRVVAQ